MKQCPKCRTTYTDESLRFCLADGTELAVLPNEPETLISHRQEPLRVDIQRSDASVRPSYESAPKGSSIGKVIAIVAGVGILLIIVAIGVGVAVYFGTRQTDAGTNKNVAIANSSPTPDPEKQRLQDELANMQRKIDEQQKNANRPATPPPMPSPKSPGTVTARVNSPNDGFLALRDQPDADQGERIAKIPHGSVITIENCDRNRVVIDGRSGRWCLVTWDQYEGYVFDAWLIY